MDSNLLDSPTNKLIQLRQVSANSLQGDLKLYRKGFMRHPIKHHVDIFPRHYVVPCVATSG